jgi:predicted lipoprotein with Yx(FWY)xxD motif
MRNSVKVSGLALAASLLLAACGSSAYNTTSSSHAQAAARTTPSAGATVKSASGPLGTILVDARGMTLYHLSAEHGGKFICTAAACTGIWHPLTIPPGSTPSGAVASLGTVKRPDGTTQVTYKGAPLYTFGQDQKPGETNGQGIKDVGTWSVAATSSPTTGAGGTEPTESSSGGGYKY